MSVNVREQPIADLIIIRRGGCSAPAQGVLYHVKLCHLGMGHRASVEAHSGVDCLRSFKGPAIFLINMVKLISFPYH